MMSVCVSALVLNTHLAYWFLSIGKKFDNCKTLLPSDTMDKIDCAFKEYSQSELVILGIM